MYIRQIKRFHFIWKPVSKMVKKKPNCKLPQHTEEIEFTNVLWASSQNGCGDMWGTADVD